MPTSSHGYDSAMIDRMPTRLSRTVLGLALALAPGLLLLSGCFEPREHAQLPEVSAAMSDYAVAHWSDATPQQLRHGLETMQTHCATCHGLPSPMHETAKDWPDTMQDMSENAKLGAADQAAMLRYILAARAAVAGSG